MFRKLPPLCAFGPKITAGQMTHIRTRPRCIFWYGGGRCVQNQFKLDFLWWNGKCGHARRTWQLFL